MGRRRSRVIGKIAGDEPHKVSDKAARLWETYHGPMQGAASALNAAIINTQNILGAIVIEMEGFSRETHVFDPDHMTIIRRPPAGGPGNV